MSGVRQLDSDICSLSFLYIPPLESGDNKTFSELLRGLGSHGRLTVSSDSLPLWAGFLSAYPFKGEAALFPIPQAQTRTVLTR